MIEYSKFLRNSLRIQIKVFTVLELVSNAVLSCPVTATTKVARRLQSAVGADFSEDKKGP